MFECHGAKAYVEYGIVISIKTDKISRSNQFPTHRRTTQARFGDKQGAMAQP